MNRGVYVWYRVSVDDHDTGATVRSMMARLACRTGVAGRLLRKAGEPCLWMEVYEGVSDVAGFARHLAQAVEEYDLGMFIDGSRHEESFEEMTAITPACTRPPPSQHEEHTA